MTDQQATHVLELECIPHRSVKFNCPQCGRECKAGRGVLSSPRRVQCRGHEILIKWIEPPHPDVKFPRLDDSPRPRKMASIRHARDVMDMAKRGGDWKEYIRTSSPELNAQLATEMVHRMRAIHMALD